MKELESYISQLIITHRIKLQRDFAREFLINGLFPGFIKKSNNDAGIYTNIITQAVEDIYIAKVREKLLSEDTRRIFIDLGIDNINFTKLLNLSATPLSTEELRQKIKEDFKKSDRASRNLVEKGLIDKNTGKITYKALGEYRKNSIVRTIKNIWVTLWDIMYLGLFRIESTFIEEYFLDKEADEFVRNIELIVAVDEKTKMQLVAEFSNKLKDLEENQGYVREGSREARLYRAKIGIVEKTSGSSKNLLDVMEKDVLPLAKSIEEDLTGILTVDNLKTFYGENGIEDLIKDSALQRAANQAVKKAKEAMLGGFKGLNLPENVSISDNNIENYVYLAMLHQVPVNLRVSVADAPETAEFMVEAGQFSPKVFTSKIFKIDNPVLQRYYEEEIENAFDSYILKDKAIKELIAEGKIHQDTYRPINSNLPLSDFICAKIKDFVAQEDKNLFDSVAQKAFARYVEIEHPPVLSYDNPQDKAENCANKCVEIYKKFRVYQHSLVKMGFYETARKEFVKSIKQIESKYKLVRRKDLRAKEFFIQLDLTEATNSYLERERIEKDFKTLNAFSTVLNTGISGTVSSSIFLMKAISVLAEKLAPLWLFAKQLYTAKSWEERLEVLDRRRDNIILSGILAYGVTPWIIDIGVIIGYSIFSVIPWFSGFVGLLTTTAVGGVTLRDIFRKPQDRSNLLPKISGIDIAGMLDNIKEFEDLAKKVHTQDATTFDKTRYNLVVKYLVLKVIGVVGNLGNNINKLRNNDTIVEKMLNLAKMYCEEQKRVGTTQANKSYAQIYIPGIGKVGFDTVIKYLEQNKSELNRAVQLIVSTATDLLNNSYSAITENGNDITKLHDVVEKAAHILIPTFLGVSRNTGIAPQRTISNGNSIRDLLLKHLAVPSIFTNLCQAVFSETTAKNISNILNNPVVRNIVPWEKIGFNKDAITYESVSQIVHFLVESLRDIIDEEFMTEAVKVLDLLMKTGYIDKITKSKREIVEEKIEDVKVDVKAETISQFIYDIGALHVQPVKKIFLDYLNRKRNGREKWIDNKFGKYRINRFLFARPLKYIANIDIRILVSIVKILPDSLDIKKITAAFSHMGSRDVNFILKNAIFFAKDLLKIGKAVFEYKEAKTKKDKIKSVVSIAWHSKKFLVLLLSLLSVPVIFVAAFMMNKVALSLLLTAGAIFTNVGRCYIETVSNFVLYKFLNISPVRWIFKKVYKNRIKSILEKANDMANAGKNVILSDILYEENRKYSTWTFWNSNWYFWNLLFKSYLVSATIDEIVKEYGLDSNISFKDCQIDLLTYVEGGLLANNSRNLSFEGARINLGDLSDNKIKDLLDKAKERMDAASFRSLYDNVETKKKIYVARCV